MDLRPHARPDPRAEPEPELEKPELEPEIPTDIHEIKGALKQVIREHRTTEKLATKAHDLGVATSTQVLVLVARIDTFITTSKVFGGLALAALGFIAWALSHLVFK